MVIMVVACVLLLLVTKYSKYAHFYCRISNVYSRCRLGAFSLKYLKYLKFIEIIIIIINNKLLLLNNKLLIIINY